MPSDAALDHISAFADFISESPSSYHAAATVADRLRGAGFVELDERRPWARGSASGGGYFFIRDGAIVAWLAPEAATPDTAFRVVGAHTDSPGFKLKPNPDSVRFGWQQTAMEVYGGPLLNSWLDREFALAGRLVTMSGEQVLVRTGPILRIAQLAPHLDRSVNENLHLDKQVHLLPIAGVGPESPEILRHLCGLARLDPSELAYFDVVSFPTEAPAVIGLNEDLFAAPRMDNLSSVFAGLCALLDAAPTNDVAVLACFDHEEVGSETRSGASGPLLSDALERIALSLGISGDEYRAMLARSSCISADAGHAVHPNYAGMHDPNNQPIVNAGPLLKINANQRYATDAVGAAIWLRACEAADVPSQPFVSNNSVPCGSTIGPLTATRMGLTTVDVGIPLLSMHSARELCGVDDPWYLTKALDAYWSGA